MLELSSIKVIVDFFAWTITLGATDVAKAKEETKQLLESLSRSLTSLWDVTTEVTRLKPGEFNKDTFERVYDYFRRFYLNPEDIERARSHCGDVGRHIGRITYKISTILHADLGKWNEARSKLDRIVGWDDDILASYGNSISWLDSQLKEIRGTLDAGNESLALSKYSSLKAKLEKDIEVLHCGVKVMREADKHIREITG